ncbi:MAG: YceH family protein [Pseudomonadales bacterium]|nr:YceH family protein [Pseudomonadales bacterium]
MDLSLNETRLLGVLIEKEITTPEQYPLSLNALTNACNQKSNREPVMALDECTVQDVSDGLMAKSLMMQAAGGSRVVKLKHRFCNTEFSELQLTAQQLAILCLLFLRGPQSPGELRTRSNRLCDFSDVQEVEAVLASLQQFEKAPLVQKLERQSGKRDSRYVHLFSGEVGGGEAFASMAGSGSASASASNPGAVQCDTDTESHDERIELLELEMAEMADEIKQLKLLVEQLTS